MEFSIFSRFSEGEIDILNFIATAVRCCCSKEVEAGKSPLEIQRFSFRLWRDLQTTLNLVKYLVTRIKRFPRFSCKYFMNQKYFRSKGKFSYRKNLCENENKNLSCMRSFSHIAAHLKRCYPFVMSWYVKSQVEESPKALLMLLQFP